MTSAIMNPCRPQEMEAVRGANVLAGTDKDCMAWIKTYKDYKPTAAGQPTAAPVAVSAPAEGAAASSGGRRRGGREARRAAG
jgi:5-methyltetrahydrofolate--homocysteine methyltransferase